MRKEKIQRRTMCLQWFPFIESGPVDKNEDEIRVTMTTGSMVQRTAAARVVVDRHCVDLRSPDIN